MVIFEYFGGWGQIHNDENQTVYIMVFGVVTSDGNVMPPHDPRRNTLADIKYLE